MVSPTGLLEVGILVGGASVNWKTRMYSVSVAGAAPSAAPPPTPGQLEAAALQPRAPELPQSMGCSCPLHDSLSGLLLVVLRGRGTWLTTESEQVLSSDVWLRCTRPTSH